MKVPAALVFFAETFLKIVETPDFLSELFTSYLVFKGSFFGSLPQAATLHDSGICLKRARLHRFGADTFLKN